MQRFLAFKVRIRAWLKWILLVAPLRKTAHLLFMRPYWAFLALRRTTDSSAPRVAIVMPLWNCRELVLDALRSALAQSYPNLEILVTDDGSTDGGLELVQKFARNHPLIKVFTQPNAGPGAARNNSVDHISADTEYLVFLDSDDLLPRKGVELLVKSIEKSGSPFAIGRIKRVDGVRRFERRDNMHVYRESRQAITINDEPDVLSDANISAKIFRMTFWRENNLRFPEGVVYEDMPVVVKTYLTAPQFDIVSECVNIWRVRGEGQSITNRRGQLKTLSDRLTAVERNVSMVSDAVNAGNVDARVLRKYLIRIMSLDLQLFVLSIAFSDVDYYDEFKTRAAALLSTVDESMWSEAIGAHKDLVKLAITNDRNSVVAAIHAKGY
jgi:CDP-glycerol glycerophosphotransferase